MNNLSKYSLGRSVASSGPTAEYSKLIGDMQRRFKQQQVAGWLVELKKTRTRNDGDLAVVTLVTNDEIRAMRTGKRSVQELLRIMPTTVLRANADIEVAFSECRVDPRTTGRGTSSYLVLDVNRASAKTLHDDRVQAMQPLLGHEPEPINHELVVARFDPQAPGSLVDELYTMTAERLEASPLKSTLHRILPVLDVR